MENKINYVDICCGLNWGDEAKGKIVSYLAKTGMYDFVCRWSGGNNAGHTIYKDGVKYKTHLIPSGIFYGIPSIIGPDCVVNQDAFLQEIKYLKENGFNTKLIFISPNAHVITEEHILEDKAKLFKTQGTTAKGIAPCYKDKYAREGLRIKDVPEFKAYLWDEKLYGNVLCEGAQGFWLDINYGNYPYVTSSNTLPYGACSLGFPPQLIRRIYGASKIYDTRSGIDPLFPESLLKDEELLSLVKAGQEFGTTTGRMRKTNWLNLDKLVSAVKISGTTKIIISKVDVIKEINIYKLYHNSNLLSFDNFEEMKNYINKVLKNCSNFLDEIIYSDKAELTIL
jgi:adenylosuccinate synthase